MPGSCSLDIKKRDRTSQPWEENQMMKLSQQKLNQNNKRIGNMEAIVKELMMKF